jgi:hypothetical protein
VEVVIKLTQETEMNRAKRKQIHQALVNALADLAGPDDFRYGDKNEYICHAIQDTNVKDEHGCPSRLTPGGAGAVHMIAERLSPCASLDGWLEHRQGIKSEDLTWENMQAYRHRWLKMLIEEFSK